MKIRTLVSDNNVVVLRRKRMMAMSPMQCSLSEEAGSSTADIDCIESSDLAQKSLQTAHK